MSRLPAFILLGVLAFLILGQTLPADDAPAKPVPLRVAELNERPVIGNLGLPLGTCCDIQATIIAGRDLREKAIEGAYLLSVTHVGDKRLATPVRLRFRNAPGTSIKLANDEFALHELKTGKKATSLDDTQKRELEKGYVGKNVVLTVYEEGGFSGIPRKMPEEKFILWADTEFHFSTSLVVLIEKK